MSNKPAVPNDWIYIYYIEDDKFIYDRSVSRYGLGPARAETVVRNWKASGKESFYVIGKTIEGAFS